MPSQTMEILRKNLDPNSVLEAVIEKITDAERCYPVDKEVRDFFNSNTKSWGRNWGESRGDIEEIKAQPGFLDPGFHVHFTYDEYSRGCHMGTSRYTVFVPDNLVGFYEQSVTDDDSDADSKLEDAIERLVKDRIVSMKMDMFEAQQKAQREQEANDRAYEDTERAEWERLNGKYGKPAE